MPWIHYILENDEVLKHLSNRRKLSGTSQQETSKLEKASLGKLRSKWAIQPVILQENIQRNTLQERNLQLTSHLLLFPSYTDHHHLSSPQP